MMVRVLVGLGMLALASCDSETACTDEYLSFSLSDEPLTEDEIQELEASAGVERGLLSCEALCASAFSSLKRTELHAVLSCSDDIDTEAGASGDAVVATVSCDGEEWLPCE